MLTFMLAMFGIVCTWAEDVAYKTLTFPAKTQDKVNSYTVTWQATIDDFVWSIANFNNYNNDWEYIKAGKNGTALVATISTDAAIDRAITKVAVTVDAVTVSKINSTFLEVSSDKDFSENVQKVTLDAAKGEMVYTVLNPAKALYYRLTYDCAAGSTNGLIQISKVVYYADDSDGVVTLKDAEWNMVPDQQVNITLGEVDQEITIDTDYDGVISASSSDENVATISGEGKNWTVHAVAAGMTTLNFTGEATSNFKAINKTLKVRISEPIVVMAGTYTIALNNVFFNTDYTGTNAKSPVEGISSNGINVKYTKDTGSNFYVNDSEIRLYGGNILNITAPDGYVLTAIEFTTTTTGILSANVGTISDKKWTGDANTVSFTATARTDISAVTVTYTEEINEQGTITIAEACHDSNNNYYGTYYTDKAYVMPEDIEGYGVSVENGKLKLNLVYKGGTTVPANTALLIYALEPGTYTYKVSSNTGSAIQVDNWLKGTLTKEEQTVGEDCQFYRLTMHNGTEIGFWWGANDGAAFAPGANKAYLAVPNTVASVNLNGFTFDDATTAIEEVKTEYKADNKIYDLAGRRVLSPVKGGVYIMNGKKFIK